MTAPILRLEGVTQVYASRNARGAGWDTVRAVDGVDLDVREGETLAVVGESGSGKSSLARLLLMLNRPTAGDVRFRGTSLAALKPAERRAYRRQVQAVFQDPASSLNPRMTVARMLGFIVRRHGLAPPAGIRAFIAGHLGAVGLDPPASYLDRFPHQLSGGQQQRIAIARAMMLRPAVIIADEPLSSLDVSVQAQVLDLMRDLHRSTNVGFVIISHDLGAMQSIADRTAVMYRGRIVEIGAGIYDRPVHPYTRLLLDARLSLDPRRGRIRSAAAVPPRPDLPGQDTGGCRFRARCALAVDACAASDPVLKPAGPAGSLVACHRADEFAAESA